MSEHPVYYAEPTGRSNFLLGDCTILGVSHAAKSYREKLVVRTVFWAFVTLFSTGITGWACYLVLDDYLGYPVVSVLETRLNKILEFPSVAICNANPVPCRRLYERSLDYPALWDESRCSLGKQTKTEITTILSVYQKMTGKVPSEYDILATKTELLNLIAFSFVDSLPSRVMLNDPRIKTVFDELEPFVTGYFSPSKTATKKGMADKFHIMNSIRLAKDHVWYVHTVTPLIRAGFKTVAQGADNNMTTLAVLVAAFRDSVIQEGVFDYSPYDGANNGSAFWQDWMPSIMNAAVPASVSTVPQRATIERASTGFTVFLNRTIRVLSKNQLFGAIPFLYTDSIIPALILALQRNAAILNQLSDPGLKAIMDSLIIYSGALSMKLPTTADLVSNNAKPFGDVFMDMFVSLPMAEQLDLSVTFGQLFVECTFKGKPCTEADFAKMINTKYGQCFFFNSNLRTVLNQGDNFVPADTSVIGVTGGLTLRLNIEDEQYIKSPFRETSGARIIIIPPNTPRNLLDSGYSVPPGTETNFELRQKDVMRLPTPYPSDCVTFWNETDYNYYDMKYDYKECLRFCSSHEIYSQCGCMELGYLKQFTIHGMAMNNVPYCMMAVKNSTDAICVGAVKQKRLNDTSHDFQCSCKPACSERQYEVTTSSALYPSLAYSEYTAAKFSVHEIIIGQNWETVRRTYLKLNIYFAAFDSVMAREEAQYSVFSLAGNFGGAASLMLGLSGVTILEVFTLLWDIGFHLVTNRGNKSNTSTTSFDYNTRMPAGAGHAWGGPQMVHPALKQPAMAT